MKVWTVSYVNTDTKLSEVSGVFKTKQAAVSQICFISGQYAEAKFDIDTDVVHSSETWTDQDDADNTFTLTMLEVS